MKFIEIVASRLNIAKLIVNTTKNPFPREQKFEIYVWTFQGRCIYWIFSGLIPLL